MPSTKVKEKALSALDGMAEVVKNDMLVHDDYVTDHIVNENLAAKGSICGGRQACAIGALYLGARVRMRRFADRDYFYMPGVAPDERPDFVKTRPALKLALDTLDTVAIAYGAKHDLDTHGSMSYGEGVEALFERNPDDVGRKELLQVINTAKRRIRAM